MAKWVGCECFTYHSLPYLQPLRLVALHVYTRHRRAHLFNPCVGHGYHLVPQHDAVDSHCTVRQTGRHHEKKPLRTKAGAGYRRNQSQITHYKIYILHVNASM